MWGSEFVYLPGMNEQIVNRPTTPATVQVSRFIRVNLANDLGNDSFPWERSISLCSWYQNLMLVCVELVSLILFLLSIMHDWPGGSHSISGSIDTGSGWISNFRAPSLSEDQKYCSEPFHFSSTVCKSGLAIVETRLTISRSMSCKDNFKHHLSSHDVIHSSTPACHDWHPGSG